jgi:dipeptide/tripeptide permease
LKFPLTFWDLSLWLAVTAIILLATSELLSPYYGRTGVILDKRKLRMVALVMGMLFMTTVVARIIGIITGS